MRRKLCQAVLAVAVAVGCKEWFVPSDVPGVCVEQAPPVKPSDEKISDRPPFHIVYEVELTTTAFDRCTNVVSIRRKGRFSRFYP